MTTPTEGVNETGVSLNDATDLFLDRWKDAETPSDTDEGVNTDEDDETEPQVNDNDEDENLDLEDEDEGDDNDDEATDDDEADDDAGVAPVAGDDHRVTLTVDGEEKSVTVKELKRLYGQEASLTRKSQEVATARKTAEADTERAVAVTQRMLDKAKERVAPFEKIDWLVAQQRLTPDEFLALRTEAREAVQELEFIDQEAKDFLGRIAQQKQDERIAAAKEAITVLERDVPGWNREVYSKVLAYAVENGMPEDVATGIIDPTVLKFMHKAMRLDSLKAKAAVKKTVVKNTAKKVVKPSSNRSDRLASGKRGNEGLTKLARSGSRDDAVAAFMERWADTSD